MGVMVGPVMGPTLGGYLTEHLDWRWVFYINVPVGMIALLLASAVLHETPQATASRAVRTDWVGMALMAVGIGALQVMLDRGNEDDWLRSNFILLTALVGVAALTAFLLRGSRRPGNIVNLHLFLDRNFAAASLMIGSFGLGLFGTLAVQPLLFERLLGYPAETTGLVMAPRGLASALSMVLVGRLIAHRDPRKMIALGILLAGLGTYIMSQPAGEPRLGHLAGRGPGAGPGHDLRAALHRGLRHPAAGRLRGGGGPL
jgi:DHA2 family multidrug resistance protein